MLFRPTFPLFAAFLLLLIAQSSFGQPTATPSDKRLSGFDQRKILSDNSLVANLNPTSIGPSVFSCRVTDVDVNPSDPTKFYVAYASGGLWLTESNGNSFKPVFDHEASMTIGDIAVDWSRNTIWVGTGEANSSRSSYAGTGMYRSKDGGKTWEWKGLPESHHIARVILHPTNPDVVWVAVLGHLYSPNPERGIYKTSDGGNTWKQVLTVDENTGGVDLVLDPADANTLYAATWQRERHAWDFSGAGKGSGIWKSTDGGDRFSLLSTPKSGFPMGDKTGRIGICAGMANGKTILYASLDNQNSKAKKETEKEDELTKDQLKAISVVDFAKIEDKKLSEYLKKNDFPEKYTAKKVKDLVAKGKITPLSLVEYLEDANNNLFETDFIGAEVYRSEDGGLSWKKTCEDPLELVNFTYGYYFSNIRCNPTNPEQVYLLGYLIIKSDDGGKTWESINGDNVHADHHALWVNPARPGHLINGNDGGINLSWDNGESWSKCNNPPVGQFYAINVDMEEPYNVYGGAQDNGVWWGSSQYTASTAWHQDGQYPFKEILGGDGMQVEIDTRDNNTVYTGFQFGNYFRCNKSTGQQKYITPKHDLGERPLRFNWQTPIQLSKFNHDILYFGANRLYRSMDKGETWEPISGDLTLGGRKGNVPYGTLTSIHESPLKFGLIYTGSDDGLVHITRDGGENWTKVSDNLPPNLWVSRVQASAHERSRAYVSLNGYRWDDLGAYLYSTEDFGKTWNRIGTDLPAEPINVVKEDPVNPDLLYVGTDHGVYISLDRGKTFMRMGKDFPAVAVHDLVVQPKAKELVIGTHGRSLFKVNIAQLQQCDATVLSASLTLFDPPKKRYSPNWGKKQPYEKVKDPELATYYFVSTAGKINWSVKTKDGLTVNSGSFNTEKGLNTFIYNLDLSNDALKKYQKMLSEDLKEGQKPINLKKADSGKTYVYKGVFLLEIEKDGKTVSKEFEVE